MTAPAANTKPSAPLSVATLARFKPAKIYKTAIDPPPTPSSPSSPQASRPSLPRHITGICFDDFGETLITAGEDETFRLWNCKTGKHAKTLHSKKYGVDLPRFTHKNTNIIHSSTKEDDTIRYHSLHDNKYLQYFKGHKKSVVSLEVHPLEDTFMSGSMDNTVRLWDLRTPNCRGLLNLPSSPIVAYDSQGIVFAVAINYYQKLLLYDLKHFDKEPFLCADISDPSLRKTSYPPRNPWMTSMSFSTNSKWILIGTSGDAHYVYDSYEGVLLAKLEGFKGLEGGKNGDQYGVSPVKGISGEEVGWTSDSKFIIGGSFTGKICMWDCAQIPLMMEANKEEPKVLMPTVTLDGPPGPVRCVKMNPRHQMLATAGTELAFWLPDLALEGDKSEDEGKGKERAL
ncbi:member of Set1p complex, histone methyl transferase [Tulasnella sp. JGI-2019a]|nr:member of Set1p complex, histone methyl transferase [Tulasnella sp. JGI-2019a]KAG9015128.1 member of Set1p complex, histone methyl transferase [Tulasnella sp. JGI-2019a]